MKKRSALRFAFMLLSIFLISNLAAQIISWEQRLTNEVGQTLDHINTQDGGVLLLTSSHDTLAGNNYFVVFKCDVNGNTEWIFRWGNKYPYFGNIVESPDSSFFIAFTGDSNLSVHRKIHTVKLDKNGNLLSANYYQLPGNFRTDGCQPGTLARNNGGYYISSYIIDPASANSFLHVMSLDASGNVLWSNSYDTATAHIDFTRVDTCANGDLLVATSGEVGPGGEISNDVCRISANGSLQWYKHFVAPTRHLHLKSMVKLGADSFCLVSMTHVPFTSSPELSVMLINGFGTVMWSQKYSLYHLIDIKEAVAGENGNLAFIAVADDVLPFGSYYAGLLNRNGQMVHLQHTEELQYESLDYRSNGQFSAGGRGGTSNFFPFYMLLDTNMQGCNGYQDVETVSNLILSYATGSGFASVPMAVGADTVFHLPENHQTFVHCPIVGIEDPLPGPDIHIYPVPATASITIESQIAPEAIEIFDLSGKLIYTSSQCSARTAIEVSSWPAGMYFVRVIGEAFSATRKIIVE